jgi:hypothetical protein
MHLFLIVCIAIASLGASGTIKSDKHGNTTINKSALKNNAKAEYKVNE